jgi:hypothetical protein
MLSAPKKGITLICTSLKIPKLLFLFTLFLPFIFRLYNQTFYHFYDVITFKDWSTFIVSFRSVYLTNCYCNYPLIGLLTSSGMLHFFNGNIGNYLLFNSLIEACNGILIFLILNKLAIPSSYFWASIISLIPSTWVGGFLWGQIDNFGQLILYLCFLCFLNFNHNFKSYKSSFLLGLFILVGFLTKQLLYPSLFAFIFVYLFQLNKIGSKLLKYNSLLVFFVGLFIPFILVELWLYIPEEYLFSHLEKIFLEGSDHMNEISGNGFNLWVLFYTSQDLDSTFPIVENFSPKTIGLIIFLIYVNILLIKFLKSGYSLINTLFFISLTNLSMNIFLTGMHERYLYHFYPFVFLLVLLIKKNGLKVNFILILILFSSLIYGAFVFGVLSPVIKLGYFYQSLTAHRICAIWHCFILVLFTFFWFKLRLNVNKLSDVKH